jgi:hypothetical protein
MTPGRPGSLEVHLWKTEPHRAAARGGGLGRVCTENSILIDYVTESPNVSGDDRAAPLPPDPVRLTAQVERRTLGRERGAPTSADRVAAEGARSRSPHEWGSLVLGPAVSMVSIGCPYRKSNPDVLMVQTSEVWGRHDTANGLHSTRRWCIFVQLQVRASIIVIFLVRSQQVAKMPLAEDNDMVKAIPSDRPDEPLRMSVLPWRSWCDRAVPNAHRANATDKGIAIDTIPIANDILRRLLPAVCFGELARNPLGVRMRGHAQPQNLTAGMPQDEMMPARDPPSEKNIERVSQRFARFFAIVHRPFVQCKDLNTFPIFDVQTEKQARKRSPRLVAFIPTLRLGDSRGIPESPVA